jgi:hypothetical protein
MALGRDDLLHSALTGIIRALVRSRVNPDDAFFGVGYGVVQGIIEIGENASDIIGQSVAAVKDAAKVLGLSPEISMMSMKEGMLKATEEISPETIDTVRKVLLETMSR